MATVRFDTDGNLSINGYQNYLSEKEIGEIVNNFISNYPKGHNENVKSYYTSLTHTLEDLINSRIASIIEQKKLSNQTWNYFPAQRSRFNGENPMAIKKKLRSIAGKNDYDSTILRNELRDKFFASKSQVFPVTRKRKNRRSSRKSRR